MGYFKIKFIIKKKGKKMEYRQLGKSGLRVSKLCIGTMVGFISQNYEEAKRVIEFGIDNGINFIDTADCYGESEEVVGKILKETGKRDKVILATKFGWYMGVGANDYGASLKHIIESCEASLKRLKTDYIDLSEQPPYNILDRSIENEVIPMCIKYGIGITPFFPLAAGLLSGKYRKGVKVEEGRHAKRDMEKDEKFRQSIEVVEKLIPVAENRGITLAEFSLAWLMDRPGITSVILGARKLNYLISGLKACDIKLTEEELKKVDEIVPPGTYVYPYYEESIWRPSRMFYSSEARRIKGTGAYIPDNKTGSDRKVGYE